MTRKETELLQAYYRRRAVLQQLIAALEVYERGARPAPPSLVKPSRRKCRARR